MSTEHLRDAGIEDEGAPCGIGLVLGKRDVRQPCIVLKLYEGGNALLSGEIDVGDVRPGTSSHCIHFILPSFYSVVFALLLVHHSLMSYCLSVVLW
jgi:hypothetical protein